MFKNGKLFGKINVIDLLVILVIIAAVAAAVVFVFFKPQHNMDELVLRFRIEEVDNFVAEKVHVGDALYDDSYLIDMGEVIDFEIADSISYGGISDNVYTVTSKEGYCSMIITGKVLGKKTALGCEIGGKKYGVGHSFVLRAGDAKLYLRVYDIMLKADYEKQQAEKEALVVEPSYVTVEFYSPELEDALAEMIKVGDTLIDVNKRTVLGTVKDVKLGESVVYVDSDGKSFKTAREGCKSAKLTCTVEGEKADGGVILGGRLRGVNEWYELRVGDLRVSLRINKIG